MYAYQRGCNAITIVTISFFVVSLVVVNGCRADPFPIQFAIPENKIVQEIPTKDQDFAFIIPGDSKTYIYEEESAYYHDYQRSYFAVTCMKGGWDCMRHYEILANGCIPYFIDIDKCPPNTMALLPKKLIKEAMNLPGVSYLHIDHNKFDKAKYFEILNKLLEHTRKHLTIKAMAEYILKMANYSGAGKVLFLSQDPKPDYMRCTMLAGLKQLLGARVIDVPRVEHIYKSYPLDIKKLYGKGMSYTKIIEDIPLDRSNIEQRIQNKEFDLIIYGSVHRGLPYHSLVNKIYNPDQIIYICGEDKHVCKYGALKILFLREFDVYKPKVSAVSSSKNKKTKV